MNRRGALMIPAAAAAARTRPGRPLNAPGAPVQQGAVVPGSRNVLRARQVLVSGPGAGVFLYSGTPGHGDLVESVTEAALDPFTNPTQPGFGSYDNVFGGVAQLHGALLKLFAGSNLVAQLGPGGLSVFNSHGALIYSIDVARDAQFLYADTRSATQGALLASSASAAGTDSFGNAFDANSATYVVDPGTLQRWAIDLGVVATGFAGAQHPGIALQNKASPFFAAPNIVGIGSGAGAAELALNSGAATAGAVQSLIALEDSGAGVPGGTIAMQTGIAEVLLPDNGIYRTERFIAGVTGSPLINNTAFSTIAGLTAPVGQAGQNVKYAFRVRLVITGAGTAGTANFQVSGPAVTGQWINATFIGNTLVGQGSQNAALGPVNSPGLATSAMIVDIEGEATFTAAGTLAVQAAISAGGSNFTVNRGHLWLFPM